jgi:ribosomal protein L37AE/L43A
MTAAARQQRQVESTSSTGKEETVEVMLQDFQCEACGNYKVRRTQRESWYTCVSCGYSFGIAPHPKQRATDVTGGGSTSH